MPFYQMSCPSCKEGWEELLRMEEYSQGLEEGALKCPRCSSPAVRDYDAENPRFKPEQCQSWPTDGLHLEHAGPQGKTFKTKGELSKWAKSEGLAVGALL